jgi:hypothetical protein
MGKMSNKEKAMGTPAKHEYKEPNCFMVHIDDTEIDGKKTKTYRMSSMGMGEDKIFTDKQMFLDELAKRVDEKPKASKEEEDEDSESED